MGAVRVRRHRLRGRRVAVGLADRPRVDAAAVAQIRHGGGRGLFLPVAILAPFVRRPGWPSRRPASSRWGHAFWVSNLQALPTDLFRGREVATATGFTGMGGAIGGALAQLGTGYLVLHFSYAPVFVIAGLMHPMSTVLVYWWLPDREFKNA